MSLSEAQTKLDQAKRELVDLRKSNDDFDWLLEVSKTWSDDNKRNILIDSDKPMVKKIDAVQANISKWESEVARLSKTPHKAKESHALVTKKAVPVKAKKSHALVTKKAVPVKAKKSHALVTKKAVSSKTKKIKPLVSKPPEKHKLLINTQLCNAIISELPGASRVKTVQTLLSGGASLRHQCSEAPHSLIHLAVSKKRHKVVELFLNKGVSPNTKNTADKNRTPLFYARDQVMTKLLLKRKALPNIKDDGGDTALTYEPQPRWRVKLLLEAGALPNHQNNYGNTALHNLLSGIFLTDRKLGAMKLLLAHGASPTIPNNKQETPLSKAIEKQNTIAKGGMGQRVVNRMVSLLSKTPQPKLISRSPFKPLKSRFIGITYKELKKINAELCNEVYKNGSLNKVRLLINKGAKLRYRCSQAPYSLIHMAVSKKRYEVVKLLLDKGISPNAKNRADKNSTPLLYTHDKVMTDFLLNRGADPKIVNDNGESPYLRAKQRLEQAKLKWANFTKDESRYKKERGYNTMDELREKQKKLRKGEGGYFLDDDKKAVAEMESLEGDVSKWESEVARLSKPSKPVTSLPSPNTPLSKVSTEEIVPLNDKSVLTPHPIPKKPLPPRKNWPLLKPKRSHKMDKKLCSVIHKFKDSNIVAVVQTLLDSGADPRYRCSQAPYLPAPMAVSKKRHEVVKLLLDEGISPNETNKADKNKTLLFYVQPKDIMMTQILLNRGADPNITDDNDDTPLTEQPFSDKRIKLLLEEQDVDPNHQNSNGDTALHTLTRKKGISNSVRLNAVKMLRTRGADPTITNTNGDTPLSQAIDKLNKTKKILENTSWYKRKIINRLKDNITTWELIISHLSKKPDPLPEQSKPLVSQPASSSDDTEPPSPEPSDGNTEYDEYETEEW